MHYPDFTLDGQVAMVTGASKGIGADLARALAGAEARVAVAARDESALEALVIDHPEVVNKSYPSFWKHLGSAGISMEFFHA